MLGSHSPRPQAHPRRQTKPGGDAGLTYIESPTVPSVDSIAAGAVRKCQQRYGSLGINFEAGDAQSMPFADQSFDIIINIRQTF